ncbi:hypothetical protein PCL_10436 [Purpureocillium lilacinum]|uniref:C2H2-type domain-containing protein n=1 Tax=Purpureocillium lilacinum TaxID=33203 RepID=A0A2U3DQD1_PURLI|nr:hypothetical protein PCL_10436 [Purpureocillium lilacinum]
MSRPASRPGVYAMAQDPYPYPGYATSAAMMPQTATAALHPQPIAPASAGSRGPPVLLPMPPGGLVPQAGQPSLYGPGSLTQLNPVLQEGSQPTRVDSDGKFPCPHCTKTYLHAKHLKRHLLRHTGDRPYMCVLCRDTFFRSDILKRHFQKCCIRRGNPTGAGHLSRPQAHVTKNAQAQKAAGLATEGDMNDLHGLNNMSQADGMVHPFGMVPVQDGMSVFRPTPLQVGETIVETQTGKAEALPQATLERRTAADDISCPWIPVPSTFQSKQMQYLTRSRQHHGVQTAWPAIGKHVQRLYQGCLTIGYHPRRFREAEVVMIEKPGKRKLSKPRTWRPISLLSCVGKGLERLTARRLAWASILMASCSPNRLRVTEMTTLAKACHKDRELPRNTKFSVGPVTKPVALFTSILYPPLPEYSTFKSSINTLELIAMSSRMMGRFSHCPTTLFRSHNGIKINLRDLAAKTCSSYDVRSEDELVQPKALDSLTMTLSNLTTAMSETGFLPHTLSSVVKKPLKICGGMLDRHPLLHAGEASAQPPSLNTWWKGRGWRLVLSCRTDRIRRNESSVRRPHLRVDHRAPAAPRRSATAGQLSSGGPGAGPEGAGEEGTRAARLAPRVRQKWQSAQGQASQTRGGLG